MLFANDPLITANERIRLLQHQLIGLPHDGILLMDHGLHTQLMRGQDDRCAHISPESDHDIGLKFSDISSGLAACLQHLQHGPAFSSDPADQSARMKRQKRISLLRDQRRLHTVIIADENNFCFIAITLHGGIGQRQRRIDMTAGTAGHQHHLHLIHSSYQSILSVDEKLVFPSVCRFVQVRIRIITQKCQLV